MYGKNHFFWNHRLSKNCGDNKPDAQHIEQLIRMHTIQDKQYIIVALKILGAWYTLSHYVTWQAIYTDIATYNHNTWIPSKPVARKAIPIIAFHKVELCVVLRKLHFSRGLGQLMGMVHKEIHTWAGILRKTQGECKTATNTNNCCIYQRNGINNITDTYYHIVAIQWSWLLSLINTIEFLVINFNKNWMFWPEDLLQQYKKHKTKTAY